jgi:hypothetical protein
MNLQLSEEQAELLARELRALFSQLATSLPARPATALTLPGAASQMARIESRLHPAAIEKAIE